MTLHEASREGLAGVGLAALCASADLPGDGAGFDATPP